MIQLCYISSRTPGTPVTVDAILSASRRNNGEAGVTGLLVHDGRRFLQVLEGEAAAVDATFERIRSDPGHRAIVTLSRRPVGNRQFGCWAMAAERVADTGARDRADQASDDIAGVVDRMTAGVTDPDLRATFRDFVRIDRAGTAISPARTPR